MPYTDPNIEGWMRPRELAWLYEQGKAHQTIVEVGCWKGKSTHALLTGNQEQFPHGKVYAVDHWKGSPSERRTTHKEATYRDVYADFFKNVGGFPNLVVYRESSPEAATRLKLYAIEMVFLDAEHTYEATKADIEAWRDVATRMLCGHDYDDDPAHEGVRRAVDEVFGPLVQTFESIWFVELPPPLVENIAGIEILEDASLPEGTVEVRGRTSVRIKNVGKRTEKQP